MSREIDRRDFSVNKVTPARETELKSLTSKVRLPEEHRIRITGFDAITGNPAAVVSESAPLEKGNYIQRALNHIRDIGSVLGLTATQSPEFVADPNIQYTSSDAVTVHLQQQYKGITIFQAAEAVRFAPDGSLKETVGRSFSVTKDIEVSPKISVKEAVLKAAQHVAVPQPDEEGLTDQFGEPLTLPSVDLTGFVPKVIAVFSDKPEQPAVLEAGPFGDKIKASLIWFPLDDDLRLAWEVLVTMPNYKGQYHTIVDAENGDILYCHQIVNFVAARGNVYRVDGGRQRQMTDFPIPLTDYGLSIPGNLPDGFPDTWVEVDSTIGNSVNAHQGDTGPAFTGQIQNRFGQVWDGRPFWIGNFSRADRVEVLFYYPGDDNWWLGTHDGNQLIWSFAGNTAGFGHGINDGRPFWIGDFNGDGRADVLFYYPGDDNWWLGSHQGPGGQLVWSFAGNTAGFGHGINDGRPFWIGNFSRADRVEVLFYYPGDGNWWLGTRDGNQLNWSYAGNTIDGVVIFNPADNVGVDQQVLNIFYYNCYMHDYFYMLGFNEADGNFQQDNLGRGGRQTDRVDARAHPGAVWGTANMSTPVDGRSPVMNMGLLTRTNRHTAFDSSVVFHEFMHGVTNRLVGGPMNTSALQQPQSGAMGEGWGDYIACTINNTTVVGDWVTNNPGGIRGFPYDANFPDDFGDLGTGRYTEVHNNGEIWAATLMETNRNIGANLGVQLVVDALKLSPANPGFLDMRDSILAALNNMFAAGRLSSNQHAVARQGIWNAFARFGMGPCARSNGASLQGIVADFNPPSDIRCSARPTSLPINRSSTITATLRDLAGNPISGANVQVATDLGTLTQTNVITDNRGIATTMLSSEDEGTATVTAAFEARCATCGVTVFFRGVICTLGRPERQCPSAKPENICRAGRPQEERKITCTAGRPTIAPKSVPRPEVKLRRP